MFQDKDLHQIQARGSDLAIVQQQINNFEQGFPFLGITKAATVAEGIIRLSEEDVDEFGKAYVSSLPNLRVVKFVPASGAASRMFKKLFAFLHAYTETEESYESIGANEAIATFFNRLKDFAFFQDLKRTFGENGAMDSLEKLSAPGKIIAHLLTDQGLDYGQLPKGLLKFHTYDTGARTPVEEHLVEAANYATVEGGTAFLHFTVSPEHQEKFEAHISAVKAGYEQTFGVTLHISFSIQKPSTDTIAVDMENLPFRLEEGNLLFRPGGHGALIENLNEIEADVIFIKNIDNVVPDRIKEPTFQYKKALAGILLTYQKRIFEYLNQPMSEEWVSEVGQFVEKDLCVLPPHGYEEMSLAEKSTYLLGKLNRPMRVCGMVKNEGEPGGGPFWASNPDGSVSLQIGETAQIDKSDPAQLTIMQDATHFNPVDLVCATRDKDGNAFDLLEYRDPQTGFISSKSKNGRDLKAQELPGLWNGAMSDWNTLFVEVPIITFNPVKTVNDLLRDQHQ